MKAGWQVKKLGDVLTKTEMINPASNPNKEFIYIDISSVSNKNYSVESPSIVLGKDAPSRARKLVKMGDVLFATVRPTLQRICIIAEQFHNQVCSTGFFVLRPNGLINNSYLFYFLLSDSFTKRMETLQKGASYPAVNDSEVKEQQIPIPPLPEQQRIVAILDEAFESIAAAKASAEQNLKNARGLFDSYLQSVFTQRGEGWVEKKLGEICIVDRGSSPRPIKNYITTEPDGVNWIRISDATQSEKYIYSTQTKITPEGAKRSRFVEENDFILTNSMSFGRPYIMKTTGYIHDGWFVIRLKGSVDLNYFYYLLISPYVREQFNSLASGAIVLNISGDLVKKAILPIPPIEEQRSIVARLDALSTETQRLEAIHRQKIAALDELKQSLLQKAFAGEL